MRWDFRNLPKFKSARCPFFLQTREYWLPCEVVFFSSMFLQTAEHDWTVTVWHRKDCGIRPYYA